MKQELSILIPVYNDDSTRLAAELSRQAEAITDLSYEIIVADDCSTDAACWSQPCRERPASLPLY